jgi:isoleucyl-tRNA synthetase
LQGAKYKPMFGKTENDSDCFPLVNSSHVTNTAGTGLVHIAPCHGQQDFLLALEHKIPLVNQAKPLSYAYSLSIS